MMERLTVNGNFCDVFRCESTPGGRSCKNGSCTWRRIWDRLKAYEDAGLSPAACEEARKIEKGLNTNGYSVARMVELMAADKGGRVVVLPCKAGDTMLDLTFPENPRLMKNVRLEIAYESGCGIVFRMGHDTFADLVEHDRIKPVSGRRAKDGGT